MHVPQAKVTPQSFEMDVTADGPGIGVAAYNRINRVRLDWQESLVEARFLICSDVAVFLQLSPPELRVRRDGRARQLRVRRRACGVALLGQAIEAGVASTTLHVNAFHLPSRVEQQPLALKVEEVLDATAKRAQPREVWPTAALLAQRVPRLR